MLHPMSHWRLLSIAALASSGLALDWWVDQSCEERLGPGTVDRMLKEAVDTAKAVMRGLEARDENMMNVFKQVMSYD